MRVEQHAELCVDIGDDFAGRLVIHSSTVESLCYFLPLRVWYAAQILAKARHEIGDRRAVFVKNIEQKAFEIARHQNIHTRRVSLSELRHRVVVVGNKAVQDIVLIGCHH